MAGETEILTGNLLPHDDLTWDRPQTGAVESFPLSRAKAWSIFHPKRKHRSEMFEKDAMKETFVSKTGRKGRVERTA